jgi:hypothetical protein
MSATTSRQVRDGPVTQSSATCDEFDGEIVANNEAAQYAMRNEGGGVSDVDDRETTEAGRPHANGGSRHRQCRLRVVV